MNSPGFQVRYHVAFTDYETAIELAKIDPSINTYQDIIRYYIDLFDLPREASIKGQSITSSFIE